MKLVFLVLTSVAALVTSSCSDKTDSNAKKELTTEHYKTSDEQTTARTPTNAESRDLSAAEPADADSQPEPEEIAEDCVRFVRSTLTESARSENAECPTCPANTAEVLQFHGMEVEQVSCSGSSCEVAVKLRTTFNPSTGAAILGGLTAWISPDKKEGYLHGQTPSGEQVYHVKLTYRRNAGRWRAVEFN